MLVGAEHPEQGDTITHVWVNLILAGSIFDVYSPQLHKQVSGGGFQE